MILNSGVWEYPELESPFVLESFGSRYSTNISTMYKYWFSNCFQ